MSRRIRAVVQYEGTRYHGFQRQPQALTVEAELLRAIAGITGEEVHLMAAGRTDAGVHACGQVIAFDTASRVPPERFAPALNSLLPDDIRVLESCQAAAGFHPRYDARGKVYDYLVYRERSGALFHRRFCLLHEGPLDLEAMRTAAGALEGTHDFRAFCASGSSVQDHVRTLWSCRLQEEGALLRFRFAGNGFLYHMVRIMVGTLLEVGRGKMAPQQVAEILGRGERGGTGPTAPACGLFLVRVLY